MASLSRQSSIYIVLSAVFIVINIATLSHLAPWIDEVMFLDTAYNAAVHGSWETTAWYRVAGQYPFPTYPPLYQMLATAWIWLFGSGMETVRSLNLFITFVLGGACLRLLRHHGLQLNPSTTALFTVLLWGTAEMAWMYRNGRPDLLCALMTVFTVLIAEKHLAAGTILTRTAVIVASALVLCSGIQAAVLLCVLWLFVFITMKNRRKELIRLLGLLLTGFLMGLLLVTLFMLAHGRLLGFASSIVQYSATLSHIALTVLPWAGETFGFSATPFTEKLLELNTESDLGERLASVVDYHSFVILSVTALAALVMTFRHKLRQMLSNKTFQTLLFALCVPVVMNIAGRFTSYYRWMAFVPLLLCVTAIADRRRLWCGVFGVMALVLTITGVRSMMPDARWDRANVRSFIQRQQFKPTDAVVCPFSVFYELKPVCDTCYFAGIFPTQFIAHADYIIEATDGNEFDRPITAYIHQLQADTTIVLTAVDYCEQPLLTLYQVRTK